MVAMHHTGFTCAPRVFMARFFVWFLSAGIVLRLTLQFQNGYHSWRNVMESEVDHLHTLSGNNSVSSPKTNYDIYMYIGCTISPLAAVFWHFNQAIKVCDEGNLDSACSIKMKRNYSYDSLGRKAKDWLLSDDFNAVISRNDVVVKLDDDTIISKTVLDALVQEFAASDCNYAGNMRKSEEGFYWSDGPLLMVKTDYVRAKIKENRDVLDFYDKAEDVQMGALLNITSDSLVCNVDLDVFRHRFYEDKRLSIRFKPYVTC